MEIISVIIYFSGNGTGIYNDVPLSGIGNKEFEIF